MAKNKKPSQKDIDAIRKALGREKETPAQKEQRKRLDRELAAQKARRLQDGS